MKFNNSCPRALLGQGKANEEPYDVVEDCEHEVDHFAHQINPIRAKIKPIKKFAKPNARRVGGYRYPQQALEEVHRLPVLDDEASTQAAIRLLLAEREPGEPRGEECLEDTA